MSIKQTILERLAHVGRVLGKATVVVAITVNVLVLIPAAYFSLVLGDWPPTIIGLALSVAFWLGLYVTVRVVRRSLLRRRILRVA